MYKLSACVRRKVKIRRRICKQNKMRLTVYKSNKHIYAQLFDSSGKNVIASFSTLNREFKDFIKDKKLSKLFQASVVGDFLANSLKKKNILSVVFDRSGFKFHGRIKAVADSIIKNGIKC
jgi:large subunit ribosomal protein L18